MRKMLKNKKKKGFTLIEMVAVVAIIGILAAILVPKVTGYMNEAKKTTIINQARQVVQAAEGAILKGAPETDFNDKKINGTSTIENPTYITLLDGADTSKLGDATYNQCKAIVQNNADFELVKTGDNAGDFATLK